MNQSYKALITQLTWKKNELSVHLQAAENDSQQATQQLHYLEQKLKQCGVTPTIINPEYEINKAHFIAHQHEKKAELSIYLKNCHTLEIKLKDKLLHVKTELKILEKYQERERHTHQELQKKIQEKALDEWVIQKRN